MVVGGALPNQNFVIFWDFERESYRRRGEKRRLQFETPFAIQSRAGEKSDRWTWLMVDVGGLQTVCDPVYVWALYSYIFSVDKEKTW